MTSLFFVGVVLVASVALELAKLPRWSARRAMTFYGVLGVLVAAPPAAWGAY